MFRISVSDSQIQQRRAWELSARQIGLQQEFRQALRYIFDRHASAPDYWGDPIFNLPNLGLIVYRGQHDPLIVHYGVDVARQIVYVRRFAMHPDHPLGHSAT